MFPDSRLSWRRIVLSPHSKDFNTSVKTILSAFPQERWIFVRIKKHKVSFMSCSVSLIDDCKMICFNSRRNDFFALLSIKTSEDELKDFLMNCDWNTGTASLVASGLFRHSNIAFFALPHRHPYTCGLAAYLLCDDKENIAAADMVKNLDRFNCLTSEFRNNCVAAPRITIAPFVFDAAEVFIEIIGSIQNKEVHLLAADPDFWEYPVQSLGGETEFEFSRIKEAVCETSFIRIDSTELALYRIDEMSVVKTFLSASFKSQNVVYILPGEISPGSIQEVLNKYDQYSIWGCKHLLNHTDWLVMWNILSADSPSICLMSSDHCQAAYSALMRKQIRDVWIG